MRDVTHWIREALAGRREGDRLPPAKAVLGAAFRDITPEWPLRRTARVEDLVAANRGKEEFLAELSHELRSPLGSIQNAGRILSSQPGESPARGE